MFCHFETEDSIQIVRKIETKIKNGHLGLNRNGREYKIGVRKSEQLGS